MLVVNIVCFGNSQPLFWHCWRCACRARGILRGQPELVPNIGRSVLLRRSSGDRACPSPKGGGGLAQGLGIRLFAFGGAYWPLATAYSDPLWARTCFRLCQRSPWMTCPV